MAIDPAFAADDFVRPGHINPLRARDGGVLVRTGQTEGSVDLCRLAGLHPSAVIIEIVREDGEMARLNDLREFSSKHGLKMCSVNQLIEYRLEQTALVRRLEPRDGVEIETAAGAFRVMMYRSEVDARTHLALCAGGVGAVDEFGRVCASDEPTLVRVQRQDLFGDLFGALEGEGGSRASIDRALRAIAGVGRGVLLYMRPEGVGDDLALRRSAMGSDGFVEFAGEAIDGEAMPMEKRDYGIGGQILRDLGVRRMRLMTNHPRGLPGLSAFGLEIVEHVPLL
jgi:3,4-dihydroxy 2-butanone 4-phosphate synthase/GTP cyclohydrolase II